MYGPEVCLLKLAIFLQSSTSNQDKPRIYKRGGKKPQECTLHVQYECNEDQYCLQGIMYVL
jgi:hypothetical protein